MQECWTSTQSQSDQLIDPSADQASGSKLYLIRIVERATQISGQEDDTKISREEAGLFDLNSVSNASKASPRRKR